MYCHGNLYEEDFRGFSYGFRPGRSQHNALDALAVGLSERKVNYVLDADIRGFFDSMDHGWMLKFVQHRVADSRVLRLIQKWLKAGVMEAGVWSKTEVGTPQCVVFLIMWPAFVRIMWHTERHAGTVRSAAGSTGACAATLSPAPTLSGQPETFTFCSQGRRDPYRTAMRWVAQYRRSGLAALARKTRSDEGARRLASQQLVQAIEGLALERPPLPISSISRQASKLAESMGEKRVSRHPQLFSRIGFVHEFRALQDSDIELLLRQHWAPVGVQLPATALSPEVAAAIIRLTRGNFRLLACLLTQMQRVLVINDLDFFSLDVVETARENLVIGQA